MKKRNSQRKTLDVLCVNVTRYNAALLWLRAGKSRNEGSSPLNSISFVKRFCRLAYLFSLRRQPFLPPISFSSQLASDYLRKYTTIPSNISSHHFHLRI